MATLYSAVYLKTILVKDYAKYCAIKHKFMLGTIII